MWPMSPFGMPISYVEETASLIRFQAGDSPRVAIRKGMEFAALLKKRYEEERKKRDASRDRRRAKIEKIDQLLKEDEDILDLKKEIEGIEQGIEQDRVNISNLYGALAKASRFPTKVKSIQGEIKKQEELRSDRMRSETLRNHDLENLKKTKRERLAKRFRIKLVLED